MKTLRSARFAFTARSRIPARSTRVFSMATTTPTFEIAVKGNPQTNVLGDCPFSHRALLTLEEKKIPYKSIYIDFNNKPQWLLDVNPAGSVPVLKDVQTGEWTVDSGVIANMLEKRFPEPPLGTVEDSPQVGNSIFGAFKDFAKSSDEDVAAKEAALMDALQELEDYLNTHGGPFVGGDRPCATDLLLAPKLYHLEVALHHFRGWEIPSKFKSVHKYMDSFKARESWKNTYYSPELVVKGWERHGLVKK